MRLTLQVIPRTLHSRPAPFIQFSSCKSFVRQINMAPQTLSENQSNEWTDFANNLSKTKVMPTNGPNVALVKYSNSVLPYSKATAILDVGCGPGEVVDIMISQYGSQIPANASLKATDFAQGMVDGISKKRDEKVQGGGPGSELWKKLDLAVSDAQELKDIQDGSLSHISGGFVYFFLPDPLKGLKTGLQKLQSGGILGLTSWKSSEWMTAMLEGKAAFPDRSWAELPQEWSTGEGVRKQLEDAGFVDVHIEEAAAFWSYQTHEDVISMTSTIPTIRQTMEGASDADWEKYREAMRKSIKGASPSEPGALKGIGIVAVGRKP